MVNAPVCKTGTRKVNIVGSNPTLPIFKQYIWPRSLVGWKHQPVTLGSVGSNPIEVVSDANSNYKDTTVNRITNGVMYMGCGTAWGGRLPCKQEIQASSILARSSKKNGLWLNLVERCIHRNSLRNSCRTRNAGLEGCRGCRFKSGQSDDVLW